MKISLIYHIIHIYENKDIKQKENKMYFQEIFYIVMEMQCQSLKNNNKQIKLL